ISLFLLHSCSYEYQDRILDKKLSCKKKYKASIEERLNKEQFKNTQKIAFVSFKSKMEDSIFIDLQKYFKEIKQDFSKFDLNDFHEVKFLDEKNIEEFSNLIYNFGLNKETNWRNEYSCYEPHNAVLYLNEDNTLKGFIEICFDCDKNYSSNEDIYSL